MTVGTVGLLAVCYGFVLNVDLELLDDCFFGVCRGARWYVWVGCFYNDFGRFIWDYFAGWLCLTHAFGLGFMLWFGFCRVVLLLVLFLLFPFEFDYDFECCLFCLFAIMLCVYLLVVACRFG